MDDIDIFGKKFHQDHEYANKDSPEDGHCHHGADPRTLSKRFTNSLNSFTFIIQGYPLVLSYLHHSKLYNGLLLCRHKFDYWQHIANCTVGFHQLQIC